MAVLVPEPVGARVHYPVTRDTYTRTHRGRDRPLYGPRETNSRAVEVEKPGVWSFFRDRFRPLVYWRSLRGWGEGSDLSRFP